MLSLKWKGPMVLMCLVTIFIAGQALATDTVNIALLDILSGTMKDMGDRTFAAVQLATDEINASGGLLGKQVKLIIDDTQMKPDVAARKAIRAIMEDKAQFIMHCASTAIAQALMDVAQKNKVIYVNLGAEADYLMGKGFNKYTFRACSTSANRARAYGEFFKTKPWRKFYIICPDYAYGHAGADSFKAVLAKEIPDAKIVGEDYAPLGTKDFGPYITKILATGAEIIYTNNFAVDLENLIKQGAQLGVKARYATISLDDDNVLPNIGQAAVGSFVSAIYLPTLDNPQNNAFVKRWYEKFKGTKHPYPVVHAGYNYNGAMFFFEAVKKAKSFDVEAIIKAWEGMEYNGVMGKNIMRACDHQNLVSGMIAEFQAKSTLFPYPFAGPPIIIPMEKVAVPPEETGNSRCGSK
jgi:branched-chain amino acid transport system substrate-binding protein